MKRSPGLYCLIGMILIFAIALFIRVYLPYDQVFTQEGIRFSSADAYYHMRLVDNLVHNFPNHMMVDPYAVHPGESGSVYVGFFIWLIAIPAWLLGGSAEIIDKVGVFTPAILGALAVIPVYFIGKEVFGRWTGLLAAGLIAILPGEFLGRSTLGFADYHILEAVLSATVILFLILASKNINSQKSKAWSLLAGVTMGLYIFTWTGAALFAFIIALYFLFRFILDHFNGRDTKELAITGGIFYGVALIIAVMVSADMINIIALFGALLGILGCYGLSYTLNRKKLAWGYYPWSLAGLGIVVILGFWLISPVQFDSVIRAFGVFRTAGTQLTTIEMQPLFSSLYQNPYAIAWGNYNTSLIMGLLGLLVLAWTVFIKKVEPGRLLVLIWSVVILIATLGQRRFGYYLAVNFALLTGYLSFHILKWGLEGLINIIKTDGKWVDETEKNMAVALGIGVVVIITVGVYLPNIAFNSPGSDKPPAIEVASHARYAPSDTWILTLEWMRDNTPEPFDSPDAYYKLCTEGEEADYGVMAWWDYGYWITRIGHRVPVVNPSQNAEAITKVATYLTSTNEDSVVDIPDELDARYLILDPEVALGKYWAIATWAGVDPKDYMDVYYVPDDQGGYYATQLYYENYYKSLLVRLYSFEGKGGPAKNVIVIGYNIMTNPAGNRFNVVQSAEKFDTYNDAMEYMDGKSDMLYRLVSEEPFQSPIPVQPVENCSFMFKSIGQVKVYEFKGK